MKKNTRGTIFYLMAVLVASSCWVSNANASDTKLYGYLAWRVEKVWDELSLNDTGQTTTADAPREISIPSFNIMLQSRVNDKTKVFVNLDGAGGGDVTVRNAWGEYKIDRGLNVRLGKIYRRFGLYNEILDAVPTYIGIEPPELFDNDHLILSRETLLMVHGARSIGDGDLRYSFTLDNGEGGPTAEDNLPLGFDFRYDWGLGRYMVGTSGYSSNGDTTSDVALGEGSPRTGVLPWMAADDFSVFGVYTQFQLDSLTLQFEYWNASHDATRDPDAIVQVINNASVNQSQRDRFLLDDAGAVDAANVDVNGDYDVETWFVRAGYSITNKRGEFVPYFQWDVYSNPETINNKNWGGDAEAGLADDGEFTKVTIGLIYRPNPAVAVKVDGSTHSQRFNGEDESYSEIRFDVSYIFGN